VAELYRFGRPGQTVWTSLAVAVHNRLVAGPADHWTAARRTELVLRVLRGETTGDEACRVHRLSAARLDEWMQRFVDAGPAALDDAEHPGAFTADARTILQKLPALVWRSDPEGKADLFNERWLAYAGMTLEEASGDGWTQALHPDDLARVVEQWRAILATRAPGQLEARLRRADGVYRWYLFRAVPLFDADGELVHWFGTNTDIEDNKHAENALRARERSLRLIVDSLPGMVCTLTAGGEVALVNQRLSDYIGEANQDFSDWSTVIHPDDYPPLMASWERAITSGAPFESEHRIRGADGVYRWFNVRALAQRDVSGTIVQWYSLLSDVQDRKQVEEALRASELELARVTRIVTMGELTASIAHEVNQPLGAVVNNANACLVMMSRTHPPLDEIREALAEIVDDADRASAVIARVRRLAAKAPLEATTLDVRDVVADVFALARHESERRRVALRAEIPGDLPRVLGDRVQLQQVLLNLVDTALDATSTVDEANRVLTSGGRRASRDGRREVVVSVRDAGVGVTGEEIAQLFEAFYTTKAQGMGMGLAISHSIIMNHGGRLWAERNDGPGATFLFSLPEATAIRTGTAS
jgi:PAS domain S-box-containing protein